MAETAETPTKSYQRGHYWTNRMFAEVNKMKARADEYEKKSGHSRSELMVMRERIGVFEKGCTEFGLISWELQIMMEDKRK